MENTFIEENGFRVEANQKCCYPEVVSNTWLFSRLQMVANLVSSLLYQFNKLLLIFVSSKIDFEKPFQTNETVEIGPRVVQSLTPFV